MKLPVLTEAQKMIVLGDTPVVRPCRPTAWDLQRAYLLAVIRWMQRRSRRGGGILGADMLN